MVLRLVAATLALALIVGACSSDPDEEVTEEAGTEAVEDVEEEIALDATGAPIYAGAPVNPFDLQLGQCFNQVSWIDEVQDRRINITAVVACTEPHDREVYHEAEFPAPAGAPFPGEAAMDAWSTELCYAAFEDFVGEEYELSIYGIEYLQPTKDTFEHPVGRHRRVTCFLYDSAGETLTQSARNSGI